MWWLLKEPFLIWSFLPYWSRSRSKVFLRSEIVSCCSAIFLWSFSSLECLMSLSGTLVMKFRSKRTIIFLRFTPPLIFGSGVRQLRRCWVGRDLSLLPLTLLKLKLRVVSRSPSWVVILGIKNAEALIPFSAYAALNQLVVCFVVPIQNTACFVPYNA